MHRGTPTGSSPATTGSATTATPFSADRSRPSRSARRASPTPPPATSRSRSTTSWTRTSGSSPTTSPCSGASLAHLRGELRDVRFFNSFNIFRNGFFQVRLDPAGPPSRRSRSSSTATDPNNPGSTSTRLIGPVFKGENIDVGQLGSTPGRASRLGAAQPDLRPAGRLPDVLHRSGRQPVLARPHRAGRERKPETVDQSKLPGAKPLFSPRSASTGTPSETDAPRSAAAPGIFTGRVPFVWIGNVISNPGANPNLSRHRAPDRERFTGGQLHPAAVVRPERDGPRLQVAPDLDHRSGHRPAAAMAASWAPLGVIYGNDLNNVFVRNADLVAPVGTFPTAGRTTAAAGDQRTEPRRGRRHLRDRQHRRGLQLQRHRPAAEDVRLRSQRELAYSYTQAKNNLKSTEIASVLWQSQPVQGDPNNPELSFSEFGQRHRIVGGATYVKPWSEPVSAPRSACSSR